MLVRSALTPGPKTQVVETKTAWFWLDDGVALHVIRPGARLELVDAQHNFTAMVEMTGHQRVPLVADLSQMAAASREVRQYNSGADAATAVTALAMIVGSPVSRMIGNFYMSLYRPAFPARLFSDAAQAVQWAKTHRLPPGQ